MMQYDTVLFTIFQQIVFAETIFFKSLKFRKFQIVAAIIFPLCNENYNLREESIQLFVEIRFTKRE